MASPTASAPFSRAVVTAMRQLYPEELADKSFDNTGLLLEAPFDPQRPRKNSALLTVDLTRAVADEAIRRQDAIVIAYHPIIFRGLKSLTFKDTQQQSLLRLASEGISVYCPHTAIDCQRGGLGDWLADIVTGDVTGSSKVESHASSEAQDSAYTLHHNPSHSSIRDTPLKLGTKSHKRYPINATTLEKYPGAGMGRVVRLAETVPLTEILERVRLGVGSPKGFALAIPQGKQISEIKTHSIGICAGSGGHLFGDLDRRGDDVDLLLTGELSHHEALAAIERGRCIISLFHSNSERAFLHRVLKPQLEGVVEKEWEAVRTAVSALGSADGNSKEELTADFQIAVSEVDRDPYGILIHN